MDKRAGSGSCDLQNGILKRKWECESFLSCCHTSRHTDCNSSVSELDGLDAKIFLCEDKMDDMQARPPVRRLFQKCSSHATCVWKTLFTCVGRVR